MGICIHCGNEYDPSEHAEHNLPNTCFDCSYYIKANEQPNHFVKWRTHTLLIMDGDPILNLIHRKVSWMIIHLANDTSIMVNGYINYMEMIEEDVHYNLFDNSKKITKIEYIEKNEDKQ